MPAHVEPDGSSMPLDDTEDEYFDDDTCEWCGGDGPCPDCCPHEFAPGTEECDWCKSYDACTSCSAYIDSAERSDIEEGKN